MLLLVPVRPMRSSAFLDLWKALVEVKGHTRKDGTQVRAHQRNVQTRAERKELIAKLAARMAQGEHTHHQTLGSALGAARGASKANGKAAHVYEHPEGGWVATHDATHTEGHVERIVVTKGRAVHHDAKGKQRSLKHIRGPIAEGQPKPVEPKIKAARPKREPVRVGAKLTAEQRATVDRLRALVREHGGTPIALMRTNQGPVLLYRDANGTTRGTSVFSDGGTFALGVHGLPNPDMGDRLLEDYRGEKPAPIAASDPHGLTAPQRKKLDELVERAKAKGYQPSKLIRGADGHVRLAYQAPDGQAGSLAIDPDGQAKGRGPAGAAVGAGEAVLHDYGQAGQPAADGDLAARAAAAGVKLSKVEQRAIAAGNKVAIASVEARIKKAEAKSDKKPGGQPGNDNAAKDGAQDDDLKRQVFKMRTSELREHAAKPDTPLGAAAIAELARRGKPVEPPAPKPKGEEPKPEPKPEPEPEPDEKQPEPEPAGGDEPPSGRKPGGQPGNDNAKKDGPAPDDKKGAGKAKPAPDAAAQAAHEAKRAELAAAVKAAEDAFTAFRYSPRSASYWQEDVKAQERALWDKVLEARKALVRHDHPEREQTGEYRDIGEKIGAARKDTWNGFERGEKTFSSIDWDAMEAEPDQAARVITKANLLAQSDPEALKAAGLPGNVAFLATRMLDTIAPKPADSHAARKAYAKGVERLQRAIMQVRDFKGLIDVMTDMRTQARGYAIPDDRKAEHEQLKQASAAAFRVYHDQDTKANELYKAYNYANSAVYAAEKDRMKAEARPAAIAAAKAAKDKAWAAWRAKVEEVNPLREAYHEASQRFRNLADELTKADRANPESWYNTFAALGDRFETMLSGKGAVWEKHNKHAQRVLTANDWKWADKPDKPEGEGEGGGKRGADTGETLPNWERWVPEDPERVGGGQLGKVTPEKLKDQFGLRAVEYGNYVNQAEAEHHTTKCAEAFMDLADVLGLDHKQVSYGGRLAMAFGARGNGHGLAHYETGRKVINMTKHAGGGSLAHEWGHFLDNILTMVGHDGKAGHTSFLSDGVETHAGPALPPAVRAAYTELVRAMHRGPNRAGKTSDGTKNKARAFPFVDRMLAEAGGDHQKAMDNILDYYLKPPPAVYRGKLTDAKRREIGHYLASKAGHPIHIELAEASGMSDFKLKASRMGKGENNYWTRGHEMFARAWESFVEDKLEAKGMRNSYLVSGTSGKRHQGSRKAGLDAYPQGEERERINAAFEKLVAAVKDTGMLAKALQLAPAGLA